MRAKRTRVSNDNPIHAAVAESTATHTVAVLVIFDRRVWRVFKGHDHKRDAGKWVSRWSSSMDQEWEAVKSSHAVTMEMFCSELARLGVGERVIDNAMRGMCRRITDA